MGVIFSEATGMDHAAWRIDTDGVWRRLVDTATDTATDEPFGDDIPAVPPAAPPGVWTMGISHDGGELAETTCSVEVPPPPSVVAPALAAGGVAAVSALAALWCGRVWGLKTAEGRRRRLILRNKGSVPLADMVIETGPDGAMEFKVSNAALKRLRRGEKVEGLIQGQRNQMRVRLSSL